MLTGVGEFATGLVLVISREPVNVETESKNFLAQRVYKMVHVRHPCSKFWPTCRGTLPF